MRVSVVASFAVGVAGRGLRHSRNVDLDNVDQMTDAWIPIQPSPTELYYYSPTLGVSRRALPRGAIAAAMQVDKLGAGNSTTPVPPGNDTTTADITVADATTVSAAWIAPTTTATPTLVPAELRQSCVPHCMWNCTEPVCEQHCTPECEVPSCQTQCPKNRAGAFSGCKVRCGEPNCALYCPPDPCQGRKSLDCVTPKCTTHCEKPKCSVDCGENAFGCTTVCPAPACKWKCTRSECPKPKCEMSCEMAPKCGQGQKMSVPPPSDDDLVMGKGKARLQTPEWKTSLWGFCSTQCGAGTQTRKVACSAGNESFCTGKKPATAKACEEVTHCEYKLGMWSTCSSKCGRGKRSRTVECSGPQCLGDEPLAEEDCTGRASTCDECQVTLYGGKKFSGWSMMFEPGNFTGPELEYRGVKCDDISSLEVVGDFCKLEAFEFGDFNKEHSGWKAEFLMGKYDATQLAPQGAKNDDISSFKLIRLPKPADDTDHTELRQNEHDSAERDMETAKSATERAAAAVSRLSPSDMTPRLSSSAA